MTSPTKRIHFLIANLNTGGAERQLLLLAEGLKNRGWQVSIGVFHAQGKFWDEAMEKGIPLIDHCQRSRWDVLPLINRIAAYLKEEDVQLIQGFMFPANSLGVFAAKRAGGVQSLMAIRSSITRYPSWGSRAYFALDRIAARYFSDRLTANSQSGIVAHTKCGYPQNKFTMIPNGIDATGFLPSLTLKEIERLRGELGIPSGAFLVGTVGRIDAYKNFENLLEAAEIARRTHNIAVLIVGGTADSAYAFSLKEHARTLGIEDFIIWAGERKDIPRLMNIMDLYTSSSTTEGLSNAVMEAMATGRAICATDVGDIKALLNGNRCGLIVPTASPELLAQSWIELIEDPQHRKKMGENGRERIKKEYSTEKMIDRYEALYNKLLARENLFHEA